MWHIEFRARCSAAQSELPSHDLSQAASLVEAALSVALLELCGAVEVESVRIDAVDDAERVTPPQARLASRPRAVR